MAHGRKGKGRRSDRTQYAPMCSGSGLPPSSLGMDPLGHYNGLCPVCGYLHEVNENGRVMLHARP